MSKALFAALAITTSLYPVTARAATIDQAGADHLRSTFERYFGTPEAGQTPYVAVSPDGTGFKVTIDTRSLIQAMSGAMKPGFDIDAAPFSFHATPIDGGKWRIFDVSAIKGSFAIKDQSGSFATDPIAFDGVYDPALGTFASATMRVPLITTDQQADNMVSSALTRDVVQTFTATPGHDGSADVNADITVGTHQQTITMSQPGANQSGAGQTMAVSIGVASQAVQLSGKALHLQPALDLWAMLVADKTREERAAHKEEAKALVLKWLPVVDTLTYNDALKGFAVKTPFGQGGLRTLGVRFDLSTTSPSNFAGFSMSGADLTIDTIFLPPGVKPLLPTKFSFSTSVKDFNIDAGIRKAIELDDGKPADPVTKAANDQAILDAFVPSGSVTVAMGPSGLSGKDYTIGWQGTLTTSVGKPQHVTMHVDVKATGVDSVARQVGQLKVPHAAEAMIGIYAAQALAKKEADGTLTWAIDYVDGGEVLVNGKALGKK